MAVSLALKTVGSTVDLKAALLVENLVGSKADETVVLKVEMKVYVMALMMVERWVEKMAMK